MKPTAICPGGAGPIAAWPDSGEYNKVFRPCDFMHR
jgi:hypothetical protein